jgi:N-acetylmuramoyl-L-alanine amidase
MKQLSLIFILLFIFLCLPVEAQDGDTPLKGEGALAFLRRHNFLPDVEYFDEFVRINQGKFGKDNTLLLDVFYEFPSRTKNNKTNTNQPVNDKKNRATTVEPTQSYKERKVEGLSKEEIDAINTKISHDEFENRKENIHQSESKSAYKENVSFEKEPLFGKNYEEYQVEDQVLAGACFFLVSGHGGPDPGAIYYSDGKNLHEDEYAYDIMLRLARNLLMHGATVHIIIQDAKDGIRDDEYLNNNDAETCMGDEIPYGQEQRLKQRCDKINSLGARSKEKYQRAIFIHLDSRNKTEQTDIYFYHSNEPRSEKTAEVLRTVFQTQYSKFQASRVFKGTVSFRDLYVLRNATPPSVYVEVGNIRNRFDQKRFILSNNRQALASWFLQAFIEDYKNSK